MDGGEGRIGGVLATAGDFDGDGSEDLVVGDPAYSTTRGRVLVVSGTDGGVLQTFPGTGITAEEFGYSAIAVGDMDGRGTPDIFVGGLDDHFEGPPTRYVRGFAGEDGAVLFDSGDFPKESSYGTTIALVGDLTGDGKPEFAVGRSELSLLSNRPPGSVYVYSGADGSLLNVLHGTEDGDRFGTSIAPLSDVDGDGVPDFAVGSPYHSEGGRIVVISGGTFEEIRSLKCPKGNYFEDVMAPMVPTAPFSRYLAATYRTAYKVSSIAVFDAATGRRIRVFAPGSRVQFGMALAGMGDIDGDGFPDLATVSETVGDPEAEDQAPLVEIFSGASAGLLFAWRGGLDDGSEPMQLCPVGDQDGDGATDLAVGIPTRNEVVVFGITPSTLPESVRIDLQRIPGCPDPDARGSLVFEPASAHPPLHAEAVRLDEIDWLPPYIFIEDAPGSGTFVQLGFMLATTEVYRDWSFQSNLATWVPIPRFATISEYAGRRIEIRDPFGLPLLQAVIPSPGARDFSGRAEIVPPPGAEFPKAAASVRVQSSGRRGSVKMTLRTRRLPRVPEFTVWVEDAPEGGTCTMAGSISRERMVLDSRHGDLLPGAAPDGGSLSGRAIEVRDGATVVLRGTLP